MRTEHAALDFRNTNETRFFEKVAYPALAARRLLPTGRLVHAEGKTQDAIAGIDWLVVEANGLAHGLAVRIRWRRDEHNITIRERGNQGELSELGKRAVAVRDGGTYPELVVEVYADPDTLTINGAYVVRCRDLFEHIIQWTHDDHYRLCVCVGSERMNRNGGARYRHIAVDDVAIPRIAGCRASLLGHGVVVRSLGRTPYTPPMWDGSD